MDSALTALNLMTSKDMPKQVYLEDVIERIILFGKFHLQNTIFPEYDPVYKIDPKSKGMTLIYLVKLTNPTPVQKVITSIPSFLFPPLID